MGERIIRGGTHITDEDARAFLGLKEPPADREAVREHCAECAGCRRLLASLALENDGALLRALPPSPASAGCPDPELLEKVAAGLLTHAESISVLEHAAVCAHCGALLKAAQE